MTISNPLFRLFEKLITTGAEDLLERKTENNCNLGTNPLK